MITIPNLSIVYLNSAVILAQESHKIE